MGRGRSNSQEANGRKAPQYGLSRTGRVQNIVLTIPELRSISRIVFLRAREKLIVAYDVFDIRLETTLASKGLFYTKAHSLSSLSLNNRPHQEVGCTKEDQDQDQ
jgi:hypothetical protein